MASSTTTVTGRLLDATGTAIANEYVFFRLKTSGVDSDVTPEEVYAAKSVETQTDSSGDISVVLWVNGDSDIESVYEITTKNRRITPVSVIIPTASSGGTIDIATLIADHRASGNTQQDTIISQLDAFAASPLANANFSSAAWLSGLNVAAGADVTSAINVEAAGALMDSELTDEASVKAIDQGLSTSDTPVFSGIDANGGNIIIDLDGDTYINGNTDDRIDIVIGGVTEMTLTAAKADNLDDLSALTPTNSNIIVGNGTGWVNASNLRVDAGTASSGTEMGTGTANGIYSVAEGGSTIASGNYSHAEGQSTLASQSTAHAEGESTAASGAASHAEGFFTEASGLASHAEGTFTTASGDYSSATGRRGKAVHDGARVEADSQDADVSSTTTDQFTARFQNGYEFKGGIAAFEGGASFGDANAQATTRANLGVTDDISNGNVVYVNDNTDFPAAVTGVITLEAGKTYIINTDVDLLGDRILCPASNITMLGRSSETSSLTSSTLNAALPLITATRTLALRDFTVKDVGTAFDIDGLGGTNVALDWRGFNVSNVPTIGTIQNIDNHIWQICAILDSGGLTYTNGVNTIAFSDSIISAKSGTTAVTLDSNILLGRRFRVIYSAVIAGDPTSTAFDVDALAAVPIEGYILDTVNFSGGGTYLAGKSVTDNEALFVNCKGIPNSREISNYYMNGNATATTIVAQNAEVKVAGTTTSNTLTQKFTNTDNRATYVGAISRFFKAAVTVSVESGNSQQIGVYLGKNGTIIPSTEVYGTTSGNGRAENIVVQGLFELQSNDYIEVFVENSTAINDITVTDLNLIIE